MANFTALPDIYVKYSQHPFVPDASEHLSNCYGDILPNLDMLFADGAARTTLHSTDVLLTNIKNAIANDLICPYATQTDPWDAPNIGFLIHTAPLYVGIHGGQCHPLSRHTLETTLMDADAANLCEIEITVGITHIRINQHEYVNYLDFSPILFSTCARMRQAVSSAASVVTPVITAVEQPAPPVVQEPAPPVVQEPAPPVVQEPAPPVVQEPVPLVVNAPASPVVDDTAPPVLVESAPSMLMQPSLPAPVCVKLRLWWMQDQGRALCVDAVTRPHAETISAAPDVSTLPDDDPTLSIQHHVSAAPDVSTLADDDPCTVLAVNLLASDSAPDTTTLADDDPVTQVVVPTHHHTFNTPSYFPMPIPIH